LVAEETKVANKSSAVDVLHREAFDLTVSKDSSVKRVL
jgi:hypothetical protein